jgi:anti-anti-sigma factor
MLYLTNTWFRPFFITGRETNMEITVTRKNQFHVLAMEGRLDALTAPMLEDEARKLLDDGVTSLILDMTHLDFVSSAGLRAILFLAKGLRPAKGEMRFVGLAPAVKEVFEISGFTKLFPLYATVEEAEV